MKTIATLAALVVATLTGPAEAKEPVTFYPTYGFQDASGTWIVPMRLWVHTRRTAAEDRVIAILASHRTPQERAIFRSRISNFVADDKSFEKVVFRLGMTVIAVQDCPVPP